MQIVTKKKKSNLTRSRMIHVDFDNLNTLPVCCIQNALGPSKNMLKQLAGLDATMSCAARHYQLLHLIIWLAMCG